MNPERILNAVKWLDDEYNDMVQYLKNGIIPDVWPSKLIRFKSRSKLLTVNENNELIHNNKRVIRISDVNTLLTRLLLFM